MPTRSAVERSADAVCRRARRPRHRATNTHVSRSAAHRLERAVDAAADADYTRWSSASPRSPKASDGPDIHLVEDIDKRHHGGQPETSTRPWARGNNQPERSEANRRAVTGTCRNASSAVTYTIAVRQRTGAQALRRAAGRSSARQVGSSLIWPTGFRFDLTGASDGAAMTAPTRLTAFARAARESGGWYGGRTAVTLRGTAITRRCAPLKTTGRL